MKTWLVLDVHYLCHRAFHTAQNLSWRGKPTGTIFGFLKSLTFLSEEFATDRIAFCFEHPHLFRRDIYPAYKRKRRAQERTPSEVKSYQGLQLQIHELRKRYLPKVGFRNVFCFKGMESDDIMAAIAGNASEDEEVVLVTSDSDLFQCLRSNVMMYCPQKRKLFTKKWFISHYGLPPYKWAMVKALAGCPTDEVEGIAGVGELTATRFLRRQLNPSSKVFKAINSRESSLIASRNRELVTLPFRGCPVPDLLEDRLNQEGWREVCDLLGMRTLAGRPPVAMKRRGAYA